jgi:hypothetical protein
MLQYEMLQLMKKETFSSVYSSGSGEKNLFFAQRMFKGLGKTQRSCSRKQRNDSNFLKLVKERKGGRRREIY